MVQNSTMFYNLTISKIQRTTKDSIAVSFSIPENLKEIFKYKQGQYLAFRKAFDGGEVRRSYSLCSSPVVDNELQVAIKVVEGGLFSTWANNELKVGDVLETLAPAGNFYTEIEEGQKKKYVLFGAGSGITPLMSIIKTALAVEKESEVVLVYGNKDESSIIFNDELKVLEDQYGDRFTRFDVLSRVDGRNPMLSGRVDNNKCEAINGNTSIFDGNEYFLCGPEGMINEVSELLKSKGIDKSNIHFELFIAPVAPSVKTEDPNQEITSSLTVIMDDEEFEINLSSKGDTILDAAMDAGADVPFSCKGAVCCTCKAKVTEGSARMEMNYALGDDEVEEGYILTCQAHPTSEKCVVDYDVV
ncbi:MAG: phenylacetic acid degradation protein [Crocinitomicaceae bacterium]|nr:phenylacetic acid degradation protein [Crocinitomicaceae bacterium]|tara:strand:+ start:2319 stop:3395 length:1077 start_codon:yes stop_codon:yes gene_type:complete